MSDTATDERAADIIFEGLRRFDEAYYNGEALIPDPDYDRMRDEAREAFPNHPYWNTVGATAAGHLDKVPLTVHMGSQNKAHEEKDIIDWMHKHGIRSVLMMDKADGSSVELTYRGGKLIQAVTRGDGKEGSLITNNALKWNNLPHTIKHTGTVVVRGEAILTKSAWKQPCFSDTANPRNAGNGTVMRKSGQNNEHIKFLAFNFEILDDHGQVTPPEPGTTLKHKLDSLNDLGFETVEYHWAGKIDDVLELRKAWVEGRNDLDYEIDGIVLSENDVATLEALGYSDGGTRPKGQIAWKFEAEQAITTVTSITITMGHTGAIIPTAKLEPVGIGGVTVSNVLLNNFKFIADLNLNIGDKVLVSRAGDVIPYIERVVEKNSEGPYLAPEVCPICGAPLVTEGKVTRCPNEECEGRAFQKLRNWVNKLDIKHLGDTLLEALYNNYGIGSIVQLYGFCGPDGTAQRAWLSEVVIGNSGRLGEKMASKVTAEIEKTRRIPVDLLMGSLGIKFLGRSMAQHIGFDTVDQWLNATVEELATKDNMGINKAREMKASIDMTAPVIKSLIGVLTILPCSKQKPAADGKLTGTVICLTGVRMTADEKERFAALGGVEKSSVGKGLTHLVQKSADSESSKTQKARDLGCKIIGIDEFRAMLA